MIQPILNTFLKEQEQKLINPSFAELGEKPSDFRSNLDKLQKAFDDPNLDTLESRLKKLGDAFGTTVLKEETSKLAEEENSRSIKGKHGNS